MHIFCPLLVHTPPLFTILPSNHTPRFSPSFSLSFYVLPPALSMCSAKCPDVPSECFHRQDFLKTPHGMAVPLLQKKKEEFLLIKNHRRLGQESWEAYEGYLKVRKRCIICTHIYIQIAFKMIILVYR